MNVEILGSGKDNLSSPSDSCASVVSLDKILEKSPNILFKLTPEAQESLELLS